MTPRPGVELDIDVRLRPARPLYVSQDFIEGNYSRARLAVVGWSIKNLSTSATAELDMYDAGSASGEIIFPITLAANESSREWFGPDGVLFESGLSLNVAIGAVDGAIFVIYLDGWE